MVTALLICSPCGAPTAAAADSFDKFLKRVGNTLAKPFRAPEKKKSTRKTTKRRKAPDSAAPGEPEPSPEPAVTATPEPTPEVRPARRAPRDPTGRRDAPYGVPVPGRPGFVVSPFAPVERLVDVRDFPSGTEVQDPYTGRIFLTP
ncbi:hypothetical protein BH20VER1_BH20VER1_06930 [soil metagenome]